MWMMPSNVMVRSCLTGEFGLETGAHHDVARHGALLSHWRIRPCPGSPQRHKGHRGYTETERPRNVAVMLHVSNSFCSLQIRSFQRWPFCHAVVARGSITLANVRRVAIAANKVLVLINGCQLIVKILAQSILIVTLSARRDRHVGL